MQAIGQMLQRVNLNIPNPLHRGNVWQEHEAVQTQLRFLERFLSTVLLQFPHDNCSLPVPKHPQEILHCNAQDHEYN